MTTTPVRLLLAVLASALVLPATASTAQAASKKKTLYPSIAKISPTKLGIGDTLTIKGKNFRKGKNKNTVVFKRDGGRAIFVRIAKSTSTTKLTVKVPPKLLPFLAQKKGVAQYTRFRVRVLAARFGRAFTSLSKSPQIGPVSIGTKVSKTDCDGDGIDNAKETDDDNDLLSDKVETQIGTDLCKRDSDGDGMSDGWEYQSALDRNNGRSAGAKPAPGRKPYANPLDATDATKDQDGDGLTNAEEYAAWSTFSNVYRTAPAGGSVLSYSGGNPASDGRAGVPEAAKYMDRDGNNLLSDFERDADGDGFPNMDEDGLSALSRLVVADAKYVDFGMFSMDYLQLNPLLNTAELTTAEKQYRCGGINQVPFYCVDRVSDKIQVSPGGKVDVQKVDPLDWLARDTDGDGINDDADDQDHDDVPNMQEYREEIAAAPDDRKYRPLDACVPNADAYFCIFSGLDIDGDGITNGTDTDDDGDQLPDTTERKIGTDPLLADTDDDGVSDYFEYQSALDLNNMSAPKSLPYPGKKPYPNPLDKSDANVDFDGDGIYLFQEYQAWQYTGMPAVLSYSEGRADSDGNGTYDDDEDVDRDGLSNFMEANGPLSSREWWIKWVGDHKCNVQGYTETPYTVVYAGMNFVDPDTDGDGLQDGADDIDHDGLTNAQEQVRPDDWCDTYVSTGPKNYPDDPNQPATHTSPHPGTNPNARVDPFNPCKPLYSEACHRHPPLGYYVYTSGYTEDWMGAPPS